MRPHLIVGALLVVVLRASGAHAQPPARPERQRAQIQYRLGWESLRSEAFEAALKSFQQAIDIDPTFTLAYYGLGKADMGLRRYADAATAFRTCRDMYVAEGGAKFSGQFDATRQRQDRLTELRDLARQYSTGPQTQQSADAQRQIQNAIRQTQDDAMRGINVNIDAAAPAFVSLALGSAYFRAGRLDDAEREYKATLTADAKAGEAHNNLAVVYMETGRLDESTKEIALAEKAGFRVNPEFKKELAARKSGSRR
jgi:tetratricopeptide (TPR) repeat protein